MCILTIHGPQHIAMNERYVTKMEAMNPAEHKAISARTRLTNNSKSSQSSTKNKSYFLIR